jgi:hypothetical protein
MATGTVMSSRQPARRHARLVALVRRCELALPSGSFRSGGPVRVRTPGLCLCLFSFLFLFLVLVFRGRTTRFLGRFQVQFRPDWRAGCRIQREFDPDCRAARGIRREFVPRWRVGAGTRRALRRDRRVGTRGSGARSVRASSVRIGARYVGSGASSVGTDAQPVEFRASSADDVAARRGGPAERIVGAVGAPGAELAGAATPATVAKRPERSVYRPSAVGYLLMATSISRC